MFRRSLLWSLVLITMMGCASKSDESGQEVRVDSVPLPLDKSSTDTGRPFCLHVRFENRAYLAYSNSHSKAWITDGRCDSAGPRRSVESMRLIWTYDTADNTSSRSCFAMDNCQFNERNIVVQRQLQCAAASAKDGQQAAVLSTNPALCR